MILFALLEIHHKALIGLILGSPVVFLMGLYLMAKGLVAFWEGRLPFSAGADLTGVLARLGGLFFILCGLVAAGSAFALETVLLWRLWVVWQGG